MAKLSVGRIGVKGHEVEVSGVSRGLAVLERLVEGETTPTHAELARELGLPKSTLSNVLAELAGLDYVVPAVRGFAAGPRLLSLGYRITRRLGVPPQAPAGVHALLERLARETGETITFAVEVGRTVDHAGDVLALDHVESPHPMRYVPGIGRLQPAGMTAAGYVLLAFSDRDASAIVAGSLVRRTPQTLVDAPAIDAELARTRERGYACNFDGSMEGVSSIAAPWNDGDGTPMAAFTVVGPTQRVVPAEAAIASVLLATLRAG
jgi:DNA-binding IclR family transcriptional regulator